MKTQFFFSKSDLKIEHLWIQRDHLNVVREYHLWMMNYTPDLVIKESHRAVAEGIAEALTHLELLLAALQPTVAVGLGVLPSLPLEDKLDE